MRTAIFFLLLLSVTVSVRFDSPYFISDLFRLTAVVSLTVGARFLARFGVTRRLARRLREQIIRHANGTVALLVLGTVLLASTICQVVLGPIPHISDEVAYLFQARAFSSGHVSLPAPVHAQFFPAEWVIVHRDRWFSVFPPGWPLLLGLGVRLGAPSLVNPILGSLCVLVIYRLSSQIVGQRKALVAALLCAASPFFLFLCSSFMSHPASLLFATLCLWLLLRASAQDDLRLFALSGLCAGYGFLVRPLDAAVLWSVPAALLLHRHRSRRQLAGTCLSAVGLGVGIVAYLVYNRLLSGAWFVPLLTLTSSHNRFGFGADVGLPWSGFGSPGHGPWRAALNLNFNLAVMSADLFGWPVSSLVFVLLLVSLGRLEWPQRLALACLGGLLGGYSLYWYHGVCFGARLYFAALPAILLLTTEGIDQAPGIVARWTGGAETRCRAGVAAFVLGSFVFSATVYIPLVSLFEPYHNQRNVDGGLARFVAEQKIETGLIFVGPGADDFALGLLANALNPLEGRIVYAFESGLSDSELERALPGRQVFHYAQPNTLRPYPPWLAQLVHAGRLRDVLGRYLAWARIRHDRSER